MPSYGEAHNGARRDGDGAEQQPARAGRKMTLVMIHGAAAACSDCQGAALNAANVRKMFKRICSEAGTGDGWTPRELRTTFVSLPSHHGVAIEEIARLAGHASTRTTEIVYRRELRPVITTGAEIIGKLFTAT